MVFYIVTRNRFYHYSS